MERDANMEKKLVICDIDNTLVVKHEALTPRAKAVIDQLRAQDVYFGIASGRSLVEVERMIHGWGYEDLDILICLNGSILWDGVDQKKYEYFIMKKEWIKEVIDIMSKYPGNILMYKGNELYCSEMDEIVHYSAQSSKMIPHPVADVSEFYEEDNAKIMFRVKEEEMPIIEQYFADHPSDHYRAFKTQSTLLEFSDARVSKGYTLEQFCKFHDLSLEEVIAFGDTSNDNDLLQASGWGVCMQNGSDDTKAIADEITELPCDQDGWADYMEQHFLKPRGWTDDEEVDREAMIKEMEELQREIEGLKRRNEEIEQTLLEEKNKIIRQKIEIKRQKKKLRKLENS